MFKELKNNNEREKYTKPSQIIQTVNSEDLSKSSSPFTKFMQAHTHRVLSFPKLILKRAHYSGCLKIMKEMNLYGGPECPLPVILKGEVSS